MYQLWPAAVVSRVIWADAPSPVVSPMAVPGRFAKFKLTPLASDSKADSLAPYSQFCKFPIGSPANPMRVRSQICPPMVSAFATPKRLKITGAPCNELYDTALKLRNVAD